MTARTDDTDDDTTSLRDGERRRVRMLARDGSDWRDDMHQQLWADQRHSRSHTRKYNAKGQLISTSEEEHVEDAAVQAYAARDATLLSDGSSLSAHRPGFVNTRGRGFVRGAHDAQRERAYRDAAVADAAAWQRDAEGAEGTVCIVRNAEYPEHAGEAGTIVNGVCVPNHLSQSRKDEIANYEPTGNPRFDAAMTAALAITDVKERAYQVSSLLDENRWWRDKQT